MSLSFDRMATGLADTKRLPAMDANKLRGAPAAHLSGVVCTPLDPLTSDLIQTWGLDASHELLQTFINHGVDVKQGDIFTPTNGPYAGKELQVERAGEWEWKNSSFVHLALQEYKG